MLIIGTAGEDEVSIAGELYEYSKVRGDIHDIRDVAAEHPDVVASLRSKLDRWSNRGAVIRTERDLAPETRSRLEALGYVDEEPHGQRDE